MPLSPQAVVAYVSTSKGGVKPSELVKHFVEEGHSRREVQRAVQKALDQGEIDVGNNLRIVLAKQYEAA